MLLPQKIISPKKCLFQKKFYPEKWVFPENLNDRHFTKENSIFGFENGGKFSENAMLKDRSYPWKSMCTNFQLDFSKTPQKCASHEKISSPKKFLFQKKLYPEKWVVPENCVFIKKVCPPKKRVSPEKMFHMKNLTYSKKVFTGMQHLCVNSEFSKPHFSKST